MRAQVKLREFKKEKEIKAWKCINCEHKVRLFKGIDKVDPTNTYLMLHEKPLCEVFKKEGFSSTDLFKFATS